VQGVATVVHWRTEPNLDRCADEAIEWSAFAALHMSPIVQVFGCRQ
jgi:hypothetical protein